MGRQAREMSASGFYHIVFRGINRQHVFEEAEDYGEFLRMLKELKAAMQFEIHAYCLMSNHVHLLLKEKQLGDISAIMKRLLTKYVMYFNRKYERSGALVGSRYKSAPVEVDEYFVPLICYIHQNPIRSGLVNRAVEYEYSSCVEYESGASWVSTDFSLGMVGKEEWKRIHQAKLEDDFDVTGKKQYTDAQVRRKIVQMIGGKEPHEIGSRPREERNELIRLLKREGLSIRQIERATGISRGIVAKC